MSIHTGANTITNENISVQLHDREEFIEEFLRQKGYQNTSYISIPSQGMIYINPFSRNALPSSSTLELFTRF